MSNSFYGGRDAAPMVIKKSFATVQAMVDKFKEGNNYREVKFGEYVLIQSVNKNNPENGMLFRRGRAYNNENLKIQSWSKSTDNIFIPTDIPAYGAEYLGTIAGPSGNAPHLNFKQTEADVTKVYEDYNKPGYDRKTGTGTFSLNPTSQNLVSGKDHDEITWTYCSIRDKNGRETDAYIGFTIPYTVIEFEADSISPYNNPKLIDREDTNTKPFYEKWKIHIPKGIKGDSIGELTLDDSTGLITYNIHNFDTNVNGQPTLCKLNEKFPLTWITRANINPATGEFNIDTNNDKNEISTTLQWLKNINIDPDNGAVTASFTGGKPDELKSSLQWVKNISIDETGKMTTNYTNQEDRVEAKKITWISGANINNNKDLNITFNNDKIANINVSLKTPNTVNLKNGQFIATYNNGDETVLGMTEIGTSACAGTKVDPNLNDGGIWFVTQE